MHVQDSTAADRWIQIERAAGNGLLAPRGRLDSVAGDLYIDITLLSGGGSTFSTRGQLLLGPEAVLLGPDHVGFFDAGASRSGPRISRAWAPDC